MCVRPSSSPLFFFSLVLPVSFVPSIAFVVLAKKKKKKKKKEIKRGGGKRPTKCCQSETKKNDDDDDEDIFSNTGDSVSTLF